MDGAFDRRIQKRSLPREGGCGRPAGNNEVYCIFITVNLTSEFTAYEVNPTSKITERGVDGGLTEHGVNWMFGSFAVRKTRTDKNNVAVPSR